MKITFSHKLIVGCILFAGMTVITYALGTWNTGFRATNNASTTADTNNGTLFDNIIVTNNFGFDLFTPTKTAAEWISMWQNNPNNVSLRTTTEDLPSYLVDVSVKRWLINNEGHCDTKGVKITSGSAGRDISNRYYHIIKINSPGVIEGYLNFRLEYGPQVGENLRVFVPIFGQAVPTENNMHEIYKDSGSGPNPPDLNINNSGGNDIQLITLNDPYNGGDSYRDVKLNTLVKLRAGDNFIRMEGGRASASFACESGAYNDSAYSMGLESGQGKIWFTND